MRLKAQLLLAAETYCQATGLSDSRLSTVLFGSGTRLKGLRAGKDALSRNIEDALLDLSNRWPEGAAWPADVPRPAARAVPTVTRTAPDAVASPASDQGCGPGGVVATRDHPAVSS